jgi:transcriptional regulator with XRE-family HTH domain
MAIGRDFDWGELGERIRHRRNARGISQQALANAAGVTQNAIYRLEAGETNPQITTLQQIAAGLECSVRELLCGVPVASAQLAGRLSRVLEVIESGDQTAIGILDHGIEAAEALLARSDRRRSMPSPSRKLVLKGEGRRSMADDLVLEKPIVRGRSEADDMPPMTNPEWMKVGDRILRRPKAKDETK